jgi:hypothetical protein
VLRFNQTKIVVSATGKVVGSWPSFDTLKHISSLKVEYAESIEAGYLHLPQIETNSYPIFIKINSLPLPKINFHNDSCKIKEYIIKLYNDGYFVFSLELFIEEFTEVKQLNKYINDILDRDIILFQEEEIDFITLSKEIIKKLIQEFSNHENTIVTSVFETYSIISPKFIIPNDIDPESVINSIYECDLYEAAIRRMSDLSEIRIEVPRKEQNNLSFYKGDMVYLNYHNLFVYIPHGSVHIPCFVYFLMMDFYKIYIAKLKYILNDVSNHLSQIGDISNKLKTLQGESDWIDFTRLRQLRAYEQFQKSTDLASTRMAWFKSSANKKFRIDELSSRLEDSLDNFEAIISRRVSLRQNSTLQKITIILAIFSIIIAILGILIAIPIPNSIDKSNEEVHLQQSLINDRVIQSRSIDSLSNDFNNVEDGFD